MDALLAGMPCCAHIAHKRTQTISAERHLWEHSGIPGLTTWTVVFRWTGGWRGGRRADTGGGAALPPRRAALLRGQAAPEVEGGIPIHGEGRRRQDGFLAGVACLQVPPPSGQGTTYMAFYLKMAEARFGFYLTECIYSLISFRKPTPPQNHQLIVYYYLSKIFS